MKAPATPTAKNKKPAPSAGKVRNTPVAAATKLPVKTAPKAAAKKPASAKNAVPVKKPVPAKVSKAPAVKAAAKPVVKAVAKKAPVKVAAPAPTTSAKSAAKSGANASGSVSKSTPTPGGKAGKPATTSGATKPVAVPKPAPIVVEPTPRPLGKRAAKKVMMEQMTQAAVVPTHAPDAAKATFFTSNERVMTPPVPSSIQKDPKRANNWKSMSVDQLTDQDVQAMPDAEYMNDVQLAFFRRKLTLLKDDMLANAGETTEHLREDTVVVPDPADRATIEEEHALELRTRDRERKLLKKIEQAITRIDSGDYGYCEETGEAIGVGRLMARPTASLSLEAQQRRELKQKMFGD
ncbi:RNA polymerase-binding protein DksA [Hydrogenophaga sp. A37]|nr:RNA polymerase-binding protein DksA [Hydrogenophaga sp. A37]